MTKKIAVLTKKKASTAGQAKVVRAKKASTAGQAKVVRAEKASTAGQAKVVRTKKASPAKAQVLRPKKAGAAKAAAPSRAAKAPPAKARALPASKKASPAKKASIEAIEQRKDEHLQRCLGEVSSGISSGLEDVALVYDALPDVDLSSVSLETRCLGKKLKAPVVIGAMTGGSAWAAQINRRLAEAAERFGLGMALGSGRAAMLDERVQKSYAVRRFAAVPLVIANLGAVQLQEKAFSAARVSAHVKAIGADALALHLNPLQEAIQPCGDTQFAGLYEKMAAFLTQFKKPVVVKEVGAGLSLETAQKLARLPIAGLETAGVGGTSFALVEAQRAQAQAQAIFDREEALAAAMRAPMLREEGETAARRALQHRETSAAERRASHTRESALAAAERRAQKRREEAAAARKALKNREAALAAVRSAVVGRELAGFGVRTADSIVACRQALGEDRLVIASGGIRSGLEAAKALALGADVVALAQPLLVAAHEGTSALFAYLERFLETLRVVCFLCGVARPADLKGVIQRSASGVLGEP